MSILLFLLSTTKPPDWMDPQTDGLTRLIHGISGFYGKGIDEHPIILALFIFIFLDLTAYFGRSWSTDTFNKRESRQEVFMHAFVFILVSMCYPLAYIANIGTEIDTFIYYLFLSYASSIYKNVAKMGFQVPYIDDYLRRKLKKEDGNDEKKSE